MSQLAAQIETFDTGVGASRKRHPGSLNACIEALQPGKTYAHTAEIFGVVLGSAEAQATIKEKRKELRDRVGIAMVRVKKMHPHYNITSEAAEFFTPSGRMMLTVVVTRHADITDEDDI